LKIAVDFIAKTMYSIDMIKEKTLLNHIKSINEKSKQWMKDNPGSWSSMLQEDIKYWNDQGIFISKETLRIYYEIQRR